MKHILMGICLGMTFNVCAITPYKRALGEATKYLEQYKATNPSSQEVSALMENLGYFQGWYSSDISKKAPAAVAAMLPLNAGMYQAQLINVINQNEKTFLESSPTDIRTLSPEGIKFCKEIIQETKKTFNLV